MKPSTLRHGLNLWPPFLFTGIHVTDISPDWCHARVELRMRPWNRNYLRTHFGGSLFAMTDPYWMILVMECLGRDYIVWDKAAEIEFVAPGKEDVFAEFHVEDTLLDEIRAATAGGDKYLRWLPIEVRTASGELIARISKQIYVRRKPEKPASPA